jgi:hypothetical protein
MLCTYRPVGSYLRLLACAAAHALASTTSDAVASTMEAHSVSNTSAAPRRAGLVGLALHFGYPLPFRRLYTG